MRLAVQGVRQVVPGEARCRDSQGQDDNRRARLFLAQARMQGLHHAEIQRKVLDGEMVEERQARHPQRGGVARGGMERGDCLGMRSRRGKEGEYAGAHLREN